MKSHVIFKVNLCIRHNCSYWQVQELMLRIYFIDVLRITQLIFDGSGY